MIDERAPAGGRKSRQDVGSDQGAWLDAAAVSRGQSARVTRVERTLPVEDALLACECR